MPGTNEPEDEIYISTIVCYFYANTFYELLYEDLQKRDGEEHSFYAQFNEIVNIQHVVVYYINEKPIGYGAFKAYDQNKVEIKRMFVKLEYRGKGIGLEILKELERWAAELNYSATILETGRKTTLSYQIVSKSGIYHNQTLWAI